MDSSQNCSASRAASPVCLALACAASASKRPAASHKRGCRARTRGETAAAQ